MQEKEKVALILYVDDDGSTREVYSDYELADGVITFWTNKNQIKLPISRLVKIKEPLQEGAKNG